MKVASVVAAVLLLCIAFPGSIHAKFQKPKYCVGKDGKHYLRGEHYEDKKGEKCIRYTCVRKGKKLEMNKKKISCDEPPTNMTANVTALEASFKSLQTSVLSLQTSVESILEMVTALQSRSSQLETNVTINIDAIKDDISTNVATLATKCDASTCASLQITATDIESCLADITSSTCPPPPSGKTGVAGGISANTAALADKCDASNCSDIQTTVENLERNVTTNKDTINIIKDDISTNVASLATKCDASSCTSLQTSATDIESCLADITSSACPPPSNGKTSMAGGISGNTVALADKCDVSTCSDIQTTVGNLETNVTTNIDAININKNDISTKVASLAQGIANNTAALADKCDASTCSDMQTTVENLETNVKTNKATININKDDISTNVASLATKCDASSCTSLQTSATDIESCLADITSSACPSPSSGKTSVAEGIANNTAALDDKCDASTCKDIENMVLNLGLSTAATIKATTTTKAPTGSSTAATIKATTTKAPTELIDGTCYEDDITNLLDERHESNTNTPDECIGTCASRGYSYAGLRYSTDCFCGNDEPPASRIRPSSQCNMKCSGDASLICGGFWRTNIYNTVKTGLSTAATIKATTPTKAPTGTCEVSECFSVEGCPLIKNKLLTTLPELNKEFFMSFEHKKAPQSASGNVIHLTEGGDCCDVGRRIPAVYTWPEGQLGFRFAINGDGSYLVLKTATKYPANQWTRVQISQTQKNNKFMFRIIINGINMKEMENEQPKKFSDVKVYVSSPWHNSLGSIRNLFINARGSSKCNGGSSTAATIKATTTTKAPTVPKFEVGGISYCFSACNAGILNASPNGDSDGAITLGGYACSEEEGGLFSKNFVGVGKAIKLPQSVNVGSLPVGPKTFAILLKHGQDYVHGQRVPREIIQRNSFILNSEPWPAARAEVNGCITQTFPDVFSKTEFVLVVVTVDEEDITVYRNGVKLGSKRCNRVPRANDEPLYIGNNHMSGTIKSFAVWNRALNQEEVESIDSTKLTCKGSSTETTTTTMTTTTTTKAQTVLWIAGKNDKTIETLKLPDFTPVNASCKVPNPNMDLLDSNIQEIQGKLYSCDHRLCQTYSAEDNTWTTIPGKRFKFKRQWAAGTVIGDKWIVQGGYVWENGKWINVATAEVWSPGTGNWVEAPQYKSPLPVHGHCVVNINGKIMQIGGYSHALGADTDKCFVDGGEVASLKAPRRHHSCAVFHGEVWVAGGYRIDARVVEIYNPQSKIWAEGAKLPGEIKHDNNPLLLTSEGNLYYVGGHAISKIYKLNINQFKWEEVGDIAKGSKYGHIVNTKVC